MIFCTLWYQFRLWDMQSEAFRFEKSFEHSPKPSKHHFNTASNDSHDNKCHVRTDVENKC